MLCDDWACVFTQAKPFMAMLLLSSSLSTPLSVYTEKSNENWLLCCVVSKVTTMHTLTNSHTVLPIRYTIIFQLNKSQHSIRKYDFIVIGYFRYQSNAWHGSVKYNDIYFGARRPLVGMASRKWSFFPAWRRDCNHSDAIVLLRRSEFDGFAK